MAKNQRYYIPNSSKKEEGKETVIVTPAQIVVRTPYVVGTGLVPDNVAEFNEEDVLYISEYKVQDGRFKCIAAKRIRSMVKFENQSIGLIQSDEEGALTWIFPGYISVGEFISAGNTFNKSKQVVVSGPLNNIQ
jgi:hypothetical protein